MGCGGCTHISQNIEKSLRNNDEETSTVFYYIFRDIFYLVRHQDSSPNFIHKPFKKQDEMILLLYTEGE